MHRNLLHFYTVTTKYQKKQIKGTIPFTIATKRRKYLGINLPKEVKYMYSKNYKTLMKEIKNDTDGEIHHVLGLEESILWQ